MPRACAHDVVGGAVENASCCEMSCGELWRSEKVAIDAFFFGVRTQNANAISQRN